MMTDLTPRDAAIEEALMDAVWAALKADATDLGKQQRILAAVRAIPAIDPAAIREAALIEAARIIVTHEMGTPMHSPPQLLTEAHDRILALIGEKK